MSNIATLCQRINDTYIRYESDKSVKDTLFHDLSEYLDYVLSPIVKDPDDRADVLQDTLIQIITKGTEQYNMEKSSFTTYCSMIVKNKANDFFRAKQRRQSKFAPAEEELLQTATLLYDGSTPSAAKNPEKIILHLEEQLAVIETLKKSLDLFLTMDKPPYCLVSSGFSIFLGRKYHPSFKTLTFVKWAYQELENDSVSDGSFRFIHEMNDWISSDEIDWGPAFRSQLLCDDPKHKAPVYSLIFGEHFNEDDFAYWCSDVRKQIKKQLMLKTYDDVTRKYRKDSSCT